MNAIEAHGLSRKYGGVTALDDVTFGIPQGSICGLLGRNGAGKTTIMSIVAGQSRPSSGEVKVLGQAPFEHASVLSRISYIRDNQRYPDDYRLSDALKIAPSFAPDWSQDLAQEMIDGFRVPSRTKVKKFSRGQLSALAVIIGLASRAPVTLLDEPYLGLDGDARAFFYDILVRDYQEHPRTTLLSTHLIEESEQLFDRVLIIENGRLVANGTREEVLAQASVISGPSDAVDKLVNGGTVLRTQHVGPLKSVTVAGQLDEEKVEAAGTSGVRISDASLQEIVSAYGPGTSQVSEQKLSRRKA